MAKDKISKKQREILDYIKEQIVDKGFPPSVREICEAVHLKSTSSVHAHLNSLERTDSSDVIRLSPVVLR